MGIAPVAWSDVDADINNMIDDATNIIRHGKLEILVSSLDRMFE
jgi:hypothetical protein